MGLTLALRREPPGSLEVEIPALHLTAQVNQTSRRLHLRVFLAYLLAFERVERPE